MKSWLSGFALLTMVSGASAAEDDVYLFDALARANYRAAYAALIKHANVPDWVRDVLHTGNGVATPHTTVSVDGKDYRVDHVCKINECTGNSLTVIFAPRGQKAWGVLIDNKGAPLILGAPTPTFNKPC